MIPKRNAETYKRIKAIIVTFFSEHSFPQFTPRSLLIKPKGDDSFEVWDAEKLVATIQIKGETKVRIVSLHHYYPVFDYLAQILFKNGISPDIAIPTNGKITSL